MLKKIFIILSNVIVALLLLIAMVVLVSLLPIKNNYKMYTVMSGSMEPTLNTGGLIFSIPSDSYNIDDIVTFKTPQTSKTNDFTTHRIYGNGDLDGKPYFITKGDANSSPDGWKVFQEDIVGKKLFHIPYLGYLIGYTKTLPGLLLIIIIPATIIVYEESRKIHRESKQIIHKHKDKIDNFKNKTANLIKLKKKNKSEPEENPLNENQDKNIVKKINKNIKKKGDNDEKT